MKLKHLVIPFFLMFGSVAVTAQTDSLKVKDSSVKAKIYYPSGICLTIGTMVNDKFNYHYKASGLFGEGRTKGGFIIGFNSFNYKKGQGDTAEYHLINSMGIGATARTYARDAQTYFTISGMYLFPVFDQRYGSTNGFGMTAAFGLLPNKFLFLELGVTSASFLTRTAERPSSWGFILNIGANL
jgi:hypothetical protein